MFYPDQYEIQIHVQDMLFYIICEDNSHYLLKPHLPQKYLTQPVAAVDLVKGGPGVSPNPQ